MEPDIITVSQFDVDCTNFALAVVQNLDTENKMRFNYFSLNVSAFYKAFVFMHSIITLY